jgi:hypothetical protein
MAARWIDEEAPQVSDDIADIEEAQKIEAEVPDADTGVEVEEPTQEDDGLPDKYKGKSAAEIAQMHMEAEKLLGRHSSEVGELRRAFDEFVTRGNQTPTQAPAKEEAVESVDFFVDPDGALDRKIDNHPSVRKAEQVAAQMQAQANLARLEQTHPDYKDILRDPKFAEWVKADQVRVSLFRQADANYDFYSANNLISTWKERKGFTDAALEAEKKDRSRQIKEASTGSSKPSTDGSRIQKKKFRRADIIKLMREDPERYEAMQPEIMQAYQEDRVV